MKRTPLRRRTPLGVGAKSRKRGSTFAAAPKPLRSRVRLRPVNPERRERLLREQYDPAGPDGPYVSVLRCRPCDTCDKGRRVSSVRQSDPSHTRGRGAGGRWWDQISQCSGCHLDVHQSGWVAVAWVARRLAAALAWRAFDQQLVAEEPGCERPPLEVEQYRATLIARWPHRHEPGGAP